MSWAFWLEGVCIPIISTFGLLGKSATFLFLQVAFQLTGNICSIWVLSSRRAHLDLSPTFTSLLICLVSRPAGESSSKVAQKAPKGTKMADLSVFDHLGPLLGPSGPFWTISDKNDFLPQMDKVGFGRGSSEQNINSCLKWSKRVQMGPKGSQMFKKT